MSENQMKIASVCKNSRLNRMADLAWIDKNADITSLSTGEKANDACDAAIKGNLRKPSAPSASSHASSRPLRIDATGSVPTMESPPVPSPARGRFGGGGRTRRGRRSRRGSGTLHSSSKAERDGPFGPTSSRPCLAPLAVFFRAEELRDRNRRSLRSRWGTPSTSPPTKGGAEDRSRRAARRRGTGSTGS